MNLIGAKCNLLWNDPIDNEEGISIIPKGYGFMFGTGITKQFLRKICMNQIFRANQIVMEGNQQMHEKQLTTVFSAPNYCYRRGNKGATIEIDENMNISHLQFDHVPISDITQREPDYFF